MADVQVPEGWRERLESLVGTRRDLLAIVAAVAAVMALVLVLRFRTPPPLVAPPASEPVAARPEPGSATTPLPSSELFVHVAGAVRKPGLYRLPEASRVADAIDAAGGHKPRADIDAINLAEVLVDGAKIVVPKLGAPGAAVSSTPAPAAAPMSAGATPTSPSVIDLNTADTVALETIPGIGPVLAAAIVQYRDEHGPFPSVDALIDVSGIGPATLESLRPYVRV